MIAYNADDCSALRIVAQSIARLTGSGSGESPSELGAIRVESLRKNSPSKWHTFKSPVLDLDQINAAAHWNYQRDRVYVRSGLEKRRTIRRSKTMSGHKAAQQTLSVSESCEYQGLDFLEFLRSGQKDLETFARSRRRAVRPRVHIFGTTAENH